MNDDKVKVLFSVEVRQHSSIECVMPRKRYERLRKAWEAGKEFTLDEVWYGGDYADAVLSALEIMVDDVSLVQTKP